MIWSTHLGDIIVVTFHVLQAELLGRSDIPVQGLVTLSREAYEPYQKATTAWEETSSVPATTVLVSGLQATDNTGECFARHALVEMHLIVRPNSVETGTSLREILREDTRTNRIQVPLRHRTRTNTTGMNHTWTYPFPSPRLAHPGQPGHPKSSPCHLGPLL